MLLARMAEAVYWGGRYLERAECTARIVQVHTDAHVDMPVGEDVGWEPLLAIAGVDGEFDEHYAVVSEPGGDRAAEDDVIEFLLHSDKNPSSILGALSSARENLRTARPVVPREAWEAGNDLWLTSLDYLDETSSRKGRVQWLRRVIAGAQRINGIMLGTMSRDEAMSFFTIGQNLERADLTTRVLDVRSENLHPRRGDDPYDVVHWMAVLRSLAAYQPFRRAMPARPQGGSTLRFLLQDDRFPRAVSACLTETRSQLKGLARSEDTLDACTDAAMLVAAAAVPRLTLGGLSEFLDEVQVALSDIHDKIDRTYFRPSLHRMAAFLRGVVTTATAAEPFEDGDTPERNGQTWPGYVPVPGRADELLGPDGTIRSRWKHLAADMAGLGPSGLVARRTEVSRLLRNEGATYNVTLDEPEPAAALAARPVSTGDRRGRMVRASKQPWPSGPPSSSSCSPTSTGNVGCWPTGSSPPSWSSVIPASSGPVWE